MDRLSGKVAIITGAASGMGLAAARLFSAEGAKVVATDVAVDALEREYANGDVLWLQHDVSSEKDWNHVVDRTQAEYGAITTLINNAGFLTSQGASLVESSDTTWAKSLDVNLGGVRFGMKSIIPVMQSANGGSIVNCSSIAGLVGGTDAGDAGYAASKGAVRSLTKHAANAYARDRIRVNSVHPGAIFTGITKGFGIKTLEEASVIGEGGDTILPPYTGEAIDIAYGYLYLASDESKFVTGTELIIDGGWTSH